MGLAFALAACASPQPNAVSPSASQPPAFLRGAPVAVTTRPEPVKPVPKLEELKGLNRTRLVELLGDPDFRRKEAPGELWQYRAADCVLDLFLYGEGKDIKVRHAETRDRGLEKVSQANCLGSLVSAHSRLHDRPT